MWRKTKLRCKVCERVVRYPSIISKRVQMCGMCRQIQEKNSETISLIIRNRGVHHN